MKIEPKIGAVFEVDGKHYKCVEWTRWNGITCCNMCAFIRPGACAIQISCFASEREDGKNVFFKEVKKKNDRTED